MGNLDDLRAAHTSGLPYIALWPVDGFIPQWHAAQLTAGKRIMPSIRLPDPDYWQAQTQPPEAPLRAIASASVPIILRTNNIRDAIAKSPRNRSTLPAMAETQGAVYSIKTDANGTCYADQEPFCDCLAPDYFWHVEGTAWAKTQYYQRMIDLIPSPPALILVENNEGCAYEQPGRYLISGGVLKPPTGIQPIEEIGKYSERMADWIESQPAGSVTPENLLALIQDGMKSQYAEFYNGVSGGIHSRFFTAGYGGMVLTNLMTEYPWIGAYSAATLRYDAISPNWYINSPALGDFTNCRLACVTNAIPAWEQAEARNPRAWRELSIQLTDGAALAGALAGKHKPISPELWGGYCEWLLWAMQSPDHRACVLRHYESAATKPQTPMFARDAAALAQLGATDLADVTIGDYVLAEAAACDRICEDPLLREFWLHGMPITTSIKPPTDLQQSALKWPAYPLADTPDNRGRLLPCSANDLVSQWKYVIDSQSYTGTVKVWACGTKHPDGRILIYAWTACELGQVTVTVPGIVDPVTIDLTGKSAAYAVGTQVSYQWKEL